MIKNKLPVTFHKYEKENTKKQNNLLESQHLLKTEFESESKKSLNLFPDMIKIVQIENEDVEKKFDFLIKEKQYKSYLFEISENYLDFGSVTKSMDKLSKPITIFNRTKSTTLYFNFFLKDQNFSMEDDFIKVEPNSQREVQFYFKPLVEYKFFFKRI